MGTALAAVLSSNGHKVTLWDNNAEKVASLNRKHRRAEADLVKAVLGADIVFFAVASSAVRAVGAGVKNALDRNAVIVVAAKGLEGKTLATMVEVLQSALGAAFNNQIMALSGPTLAAELAQKKPTAAMLASFKANAYSQRARAALANDWFHVYETRDVLGVELGGVAKHVLAIMAGVMDGLSAGSNARAWMLVEAFRDISRLIWKLGGAQETVYGLATLGDIFATAFSADSRNRRFGELLGAGKTLARAQAAAGETVEGIHAVESLYKLALREKLNLPTLEALYKVLILKKGVKAVFNDLLKSF